jgi:hypothetical protein
VRGRTPSVGSTSIRSSATPPVGTDLGPSGDHLVEDLDDGSFRHLVGLDSPNGRIDVSLEHEFIVVESARSLDGLRVAADPAACELSKGQGSVAGV